MRRCQSPRIPLVVTARAACIGLRRVSEQSPSMIQRTGPQLWLCKWGYTWAQRVLSASYTDPGSPALCFAGIETPSATPGTPTPVPSPIRWIAGCGLSGQLAPSGSWTFQFDVTYQVAVGLPLPANTGRVTMTLTHDANDSVPANNVVTWNP